MVKDYEDYIDKMCDLFPELNREDIEDIVKFGLNRMCDYICDGFEYAVDYKWPKSSFLIGWKNVCTMTNFKKNVMKRKEQWLSTKRNTMAYAKEHNISISKAKRMINEEKRKQCQEETNL